MGFTAESKKHGADVANQMFEFEEAALMQYAEIVDKEGIDCDMHVTRAFDVCMTKDGAEQAQRDFEARKKAFPRSMANGDVRDVKGTTELEAVTGIKGGYWGASYPAGHLWPYKLAAGCE